MNASNVGIGPYLYLPIEVSARELDAKLLITSFAVKRGFEVVIGQKWLMQRNLAAVPPGVVLFKTLTPRDAKAMRQAHAHGHRVAAIDEEAPGLVTRTEGLRWVFEGAVEESDVIFAVGDEYLETLARRFPDFRHKCEAVGNPRWDLLRPEFIESHAEDVARIRQEFGRIILINTNLGLTNNAKGPPEQVVRILERGHKFDRRRPADAAYISEHRRLEEASLSGIKALLPRLSARFPEHRIIVRPHPGEKVETWQDIVAGSPTAEVVQRGSAVPWILAADVLVHAYCTTGVEAFALAKPAVCFMPARSAVLENYLSPRINLVGETIDTVVSQIAAILDSGPSAFAYPAEFHATFQRSFAAWRGEFAAARIVDCLAQRFRVPLPKEAQRSCWRPGRNYAWTMQRKRHQSRVMPEMSGDEILGRLHRFSQQAGNAPQFKIQACGDRLFHIHGNAEEPDQLYQMPRAAWPARLFRWLPSAVSGG